MEKQRSLKVNMIMNIILTTSNFIFPLITYSYVARVIMPEGTGKVAFVQSVLAYFLYISALGIPNYGIRECAKVRDNKDELSQLVQELLIINVLSTVLAYIVLILTIIYVPKFHEYIPLFAIMSTSIVLQTLGMEWLYKALEKYSYITIRSLVFKVISVILTFVFVKSAKDYIAYGAITIFTTSASYVLNFYNSRKYISYKKRRKYCFKRHMKPIMIFFFSVVVTTIYGNFDSMMLGFMKGDGEVGMYNAATKIKTIVLSLSTAITSVLLPRMSLLYSRKEEEKYQELLNKSFRITLLLLVPISSFVIFSAKDILLFIAGERYVSAKPTLIVLMLCVMTLSLTNLFGNQILVPQGKENRYSQSVFIGLFINLGLNFLAIPRLGATGAALATLATEVFNAIYMGLGCAAEITKILKSVKIKKYLISLIAGITLCVGFGAWIKSNMIPFVRLAIIALPYFMLYYGLLVIQKEPYVLYMIDIAKEKIKGRNAIISKGYRK